MHRKEHAQLVKLVRYRNIGPHFVDNRSVVSYCPYLTLHYNAHINVECTSGFHAVKYIYKVGLLFSVWTRYSEYEFDAVYLQRS